MSEPIQVILKQGGPAYSGLITFDGVILEVFGFATQGSRRFHIATIERVELSFKSGMLATPTFKVNGRIGGGLSEVQAVKPDEREQGELIALAEAVNTEAEKYEGITQ